MSKIFLSWKLRILNGNTTKFRFLDLNRNKDSDSFNVELSKLLGLEKPAYKNRVL